MISDDPVAPGIVDLVRGTASFGDIITRDRGSRAHLVGAGQVGNDIAGVMRSQMLWAAVGALSQSYDYLVIDGGALDPSVGNINTVINDSCAITHFGVS